VRSADGLPALLVLGSSGLRGRQGLLLLHVSIQVELCAARDEERIGGGLAMEGFEAAAGYWAKRISVFEELSSG
jgi:hypothetical protein